MADILKPVTPLEKVTVILSEEEEEEYELEKEGIDLLSSLVIPFLNIPLHPFPFFLVQIGLWFFLVVYILNYSYTPGIPRTMDILESWYLLKDS